MRILICDGEIQCSEAIHAAICRWAEQKSLSAVSIDTYASSEDALASLQCKVMYDIVFLDIQFPGELNGLQLARELRALNEQMNIVFISNCREYAVDGYRVNALRFFYKPISDVQIFECMDIVYRQWRLTIDTYLLIDNKKILSRIPYRSILYIESQAHYIRINTVNDDKDTSAIRKKLSEIIKDLPNEMFVQCHRSFVVNLLYVREISQKRILLTDGSEIPIGSQYRVTVLTRFRHFYQGSSL